MNNASVDQLGLVKVDGKTIVVDENGVISLASANTTPEVSGDTLEFYIDQTTSVPDEIIQYTGANKDFKPVRINFDTKEFDYGSWKDNWLLKKFRPCALKHDGTVDYYLNPDDLTLKEDGSAADYTNKDYDGELMTEIGQIWIKEEEEEDGRIHIWLSPTQQEGFDCLSHTNANGKIIDYIYIGTDYSSLDRAKCQSYGEGWDIVEWSFFRLIQYCTVIVGKTTNSEIVQKGGIYDDGPMSIFHIDGLGRWGGDAVLGYIYHQGEYNYDATAGDGFYLKMTPPYSLEFDNTNLTLENLQSSGYMRLTDETVNAAEGANDSFITKMKLIKGYGLFPIEWDYSDSGPGIGWCDSDNIYYAYSFMRIGMGCDSTSIENVGTSAGIFARYVAYSDNGRLEYKSPA